MIADCPLIKEPEVKHFPQGKIMGFADNLVEEWFPPRTAPTQEQIDTVSFYNDWTT